MAEALKVKPRAKTGLRTLLAGVVGRAIRRSFFRLVLLFFLLLVAVGVVVNLLANRGNANRLLETVAASLLDPHRARSPGIAIAQPFPAQALPETAR